MKTLRIVLGCALALGSTLNVARADIETTATNAVYSGANVFWVATDTLFVNNGYVFIGGTGYYNAGLTSLVTGGAHPNAVFDQGLASQPAPQAATTAYYVYAMEYLVGTAHTVSIVISTVSPRPDGIPQQILTFTPNGTNQTLQSTYNGVFLGSYITDDQKHIVPFARNGEEVNLNFGLTSFPIGMATFKPADANYPETIAVAPNVDSTKGVTYPVPRTADGLIVNASLAANNGGSLLAILDPYLLTTGGLGCTTVSPQFMLAPPQTGGSPFNFLLRVQTARFGSATINAVECYRPATNETFSFAYQGYVENVNHQASCGIDGWPCTADSDCCAGGWTCDLTNSVCVLCIANGQPASTDEACCSDTRTNSTTCCGQAGGPCNVDTDCCTGNSCENGSCKACKPDGDTTCTQDSDCCTDLCVTVGSGKRCEGSLGDPCPNGDTDCRSDQSIDCENAVCSLCTPDNATGCNSLPCCSDEIVGSCNACNTCRTACMVNGAAPCCAGSDCCSGTCAGGTCCNPNPHACLTDADCCYGSACEGGNCLALGVCKLNGVACTTGADCCSDYCNLCPGLGICQAQTSCVARGNGCPGGACTCCPGEDDSPSYCVCDVCTATPCAAARHECNDTCCCPGETCAGAVGAKLCCSNLGPNGGLCAAPADCCPQTGNQNTIACVNQHCCEHNGGFCNGPSDCCGNNCNTNFHTCTGG